MKLLEAAVSFLAGSVKVALAVSRSACFVCLRIRRPAGVSESLSFDLLPPVSPTRPVATRMGFSLLAALERCAPGGTRYQDTTKPPGPGGAMVNVYPPALRTAPISAFLPGGGAVTCANRVLI